LGMDVEALFRPHIDDLESYEAPDLEAMAERAGVRPEQLIRLDANENPYGLSPRAAEALARLGQAGASAAYGYYPDYQALEAAVAHYAGVKGENVVLGNGGDEIIDLLVRLFVAPGEGVIICPPAFSMYALTTRAHGGVVLSVPRHDDFALDVPGIERLARAPSPGETDGPEVGVAPKLLFVTTPGNPDGRPVSLETVRRLLKLPLAVVVDEAYIEFGGEPVLPLLAEFPNLIVLRTFSKWAGMAGLRLGYAVASEEVIGAMCRLRPPYNVNAAAVVAGLATFEDMSCVQAGIRRIVAERDRLHAALAKFSGAEPVPSQGNFVLCRFRGRSGPELADALAEMGILVRSFSDPGLSDALRVTVGRPEQNDAVISALAEALGAPIPTSAGAPAAPLSLDRLEAELARPAVGPRTARHGEVQRQTGETNVSVSLDLDGTGSFEADTGLGFLDHMLAQLAVHGLFDLSVHARGDLEIDEHHTVEDVAIALGQALDSALGERRGIVRMGDCYAPLDEALAHVVVDLSGRPYAVVQVAFDTPYIGSLSTDLIVHFLETLAAQARISLHARVLYGRNDHHRAEALFKALGRALDAACRVDPRRQGIPSSKGVL
jgi:histidinol-phosphate aminotransferase